ncbi:3-oxoacyl-[acyl-carrier-protein] reductase [Clostridium sp. BSD9I1]|uniref:3-oxoacyl-[acyl-carrier-protein] reductase n=1 Tax=Clostridium sp. BSD9I1 TaxID=2003589 RepID=UPI001648BEAA|nr:3-oxoacyl-[acyl-carrier-protein] reductase [Clostridium sp. BSD9I1]
MNLQSKVALITGSGKGIGKAIAIMLASAGADIIINDISMKDAEETAAEIKAMGRKVMTSNANVCAREQVEQLFNDIKTQFGRLDILVNNAGITRDGLFLKMTDEQWNQVIDINLNGVFYCTQSAALLMKEQNSGKIVNLSSMAGQAGNVGQVNYSTSKAGVIGMTKTLSKELARFNINVNAVAPGIIKTSMTDAIPEKVMEGMLKQIPLGKIGLPEDIAKLVKFLVSEDSNYITGQVIACNGGWYV